MRLPHILALLALAVIVPAAAAGAGSFFSTSWPTALARPDGPCFMAGQTGYRLTPKPQADYIVRIVPDGADLVIELVNDPAAADFVLIDDSSDVRSCERATSVRTVRLDNAATDADLTIALSKETSAGHVRVYAQAAGVSPQDAAALFAVVWKGARKRNVALHH